MKPSFGKCHFIVVSLVLMILLAGGLATHSYSQRVGINTTGALPNASALLDVDAVPGNNMGLLIPRVPLQSTTDVVTIPAPAVSLLVYNSNPAMTGGALGYWYWDGAQWVQLGVTGGGNSWLLLGNAGTVDGVNFLGTTDNIALSFRVNNQKAGRIDQTGPTFLGYQAGNNNSSIQSTGIGYQSLFSNTTGDYNTATGYQALYSNTTGYYNTANGIEALRSNTSGSHNTATGYQALFYNTSGNFNTATGRQALVSNTTGNNNTAIGTNALLFNTTGISNTATGMEALHNNVSGPDNTATGAYALKSNTDGGFNTATGVDALRSNVTGYHNTATGWSALYYNTAYYNTATGSSALYSNNAGEKNTATGYSGLYSNISGDANTANGYLALYSNTSGDANTASGWSALFSNTSGDFNTATGINALFFNQTGVSNTANGNGALYNTTGSYNTATGNGALQANTTGAYNSALGYNAFAAGAGFSNSTAIGANAVIGVSNKVRIGDVNVTTVETQLNYSTVSDGRFKNNISEEVKGLDFINRLRPVVYNFDTKKFDEFLMKNMPDSMREKRLKETDYSESSSIRQSGFIAQEVEQAAKESGYNFNGVHKPVNENDNYSIAYSLLTVPLVKSVQELTAKNKGLELKISQLKSDYESRIKKLEELVEEIKK